MNVYNSYDERRMRVIINGLTQTYYSKTIFFHKIRIIITIIDKKSSGNPISQRLYMLYV